MRAAPPHNPLRPPVVRRVDTDVLLARWRDAGDRRAREELVERYMMLARRLAARYRSPNEPFEDLAQVAFLGLLTAIDRYDPTRGVAFPAFAVPTVLGELKKYFRRSGWSVHVPRGAQEMAQRVERASRDIVARSGRQPRVHELAEYLEVSAEEVVVGLEAGAAHYAQSLDAPVIVSGTEEQRTLMDTLGRSEEAYEAIELVMSLSSAIARLPYLERRALSLRLEHGVKQSEIAGELDCSQMQVSRLLRRAAGHLADAMDAPR